jgi:outer membrane protein TolC
MTSPSSTRLLLVATLSLVVGGCVLRPDGADELSRSRDATADRLGYATDTAAARAAAPELPADPTWQQVLERALRANGELEAMFHEWAMAIERIDQEGTWPTAPLEIGFDQMFGGESMKTFDRMTFSVGLADGTALPNKTRVAAEVAHRDAQAAAERFRAAKFDLQDRVLEAWFSYALQAERVRVQSQNVSLLQMVAETAASRVRAGASQQEQLRADVEARLAENELASAQAELVQQRSRLNALLRRSPDAPLDPPATLPPPRPLAADDATLLAVGAANHPQLAALAFEREARVAEIRRAELEYQPDVNVMAAFTGSVSQSLGAAVMLPTQWPKIRAMVAESRSNLRRVEATARQARADVAGEYVATLAALRDAERRADVFQQSIVPLTERTVSLTRNAYASGGATYLDLIDTQRTLLDVKLMVAEARMTRETLLARLEALAGVDVETLERSAATQPTTPTTNPEANRP